MGTPNAGSGRRSVGYGLAAAAVTGLLLTGCGGAGAGTERSAGSGTSGASTGQGAVAAAAPMSGLSAGAPGQVPAGAAGAGPPRPQASVVLPALLDRSVIRTATIQVRVKNVLDSSGQVQALAVSVGGYVAGEQTQADPDHPALSQAVLTLRVPGTALAQLLTGVSHLGGLLGQSQSSTDVTGQVIDVAARLASQQASVDRIRALLGQATTLGQVIQIEGELATREGELESLKGQAKQLADQTELATVTATLVGPEAPAPVVPAPQKGFAHGLSQGWGAFTAATTWLATALGAVLPFLIIAVPLGAVGWAARRRRAPLAAGPEPAGPEIA